MSILQFIQSLKLVWFLLSLRLRLIHFLVLLLTLCLVGLAWICYILILLKN